MIGQERLRNMFKLFVEGNQLPRFSILTGVAGIGKKTLCKWLGDEMQEQGFTIYKLPDIKIDSIREMIDLSYKAVNPTLYVIADADNMSTAAKNSLLKITEEPPNNAYFVMTLEDATMTLETIKSRASIFALDNYKKAEIEQYTKRTHKPNERELEIISEICDVPGDVEKLYESKPIEFYDYVKMVVDNIADVEGANSFKIADKLALKQDSLGYDAKLFLRAFMAICVERLNEDPLRYASGISITSKYLSQFGIRGISKAMLIDSWILEIRRYWMR